jgi:uncharacterized protein DUF6603
MTALGATLARVLDLVASSLAPLADELETPERALQLLSDVGVLLDEAPASVLALGPKAAAIRSDLDAMRAASGPSEIVAALELSASLAELTGALVLLGPDLVGEIGEAPEQPARADVGRRLMDRLLVDAMATRLPTLHAVLRLLDVVHVGDDPSPGTGTVPAGPDYPVDLDAWVTLEPPLDGGDHARPVPDWDEAGTDVVVRRRRTMRTDRVRTLLTAPQAFVRDVLGWGSADFRGMDALAPLADVASALGLDVSVGVRRDPGADPEATDLPLDPVVHVVLLTAPGAYGAVTVGAELAPLAPTAVHGTDGGIAIAPYAEGSAELSFRLTDGCELALEGDMDLSGNVRVALRAGRPARLELDPYGTGEGATSGSLSVTLTLAPAAGLSVIDQPGLVSVGADALELRVDLVPALTLSASLRGARLELGTQDADGFLRTVLPSLGATVDATLEWSDAGGFRLAGMPDLRVTIPIDEELGAIRVSSLELAIETGVPDAITLTARLDAGLTFGPFAAVATGFGAALAARLAEAGGNLGPANLDAASFLWPRGIGLSLEVPDVVTGGGEIAYDESTGRYTGALALAFPVVSLGAIVVVDTRLPDDPDGWALFASIFATFPSIPLGFGFFLSGVGGLLCLNRTADAEAIAAGLRSGAVDAILFPDDPLGDAALIVSQLDGWFPLAEGSTVIGIAASITWGAPRALVTGEVGVMVSFPEITVMLLGSVSMVLPDEAAPELELHMDSLGVIDVAEGTVWVTASLYDSSLLRTIQLSGDMAMYARFGSEPFFLLSVGGYNEHFRPPQELPASVTDLRRVGYEIALSDEIWFGLAGYVAVTSNTLQFGASATVEASTSVLLTTYTATGSVHFDVLLVFSPFAFVVDTGAKVSVTAGGADLVHADLTIHLEGPKPWYATGSGDVDFLGLDVRFDVTFGGAEGAESPPRINVAELVVDALELAEAWEASTPAGDAVLMSDPATADGDEVLARPDADLIARQGVAPLDRDLDVYGCYAVDGATRIALGRAGITGIATATSEPVTDWFAPAQYDAMTVNEKLAAPSYEEMTAGARITAGGTAVPAGAQTVTPDPEVRILEAAATRPGRGTALPGAAAAARALSTARRAGEPRRVRVPSFTVTEPRWTSVDPTSGRATGEAGSYHTTLGALRRRRRRDPGARIAPAHATRPSA